MAEKIPAPKEHGQNMRPAEAARYVGLSASKMAKLRMETNRHEGPKFVMVCGVVVYRRSDLDRWLDAHVVEAD